MPKITLLQVETITYRDDADLNLLIKKHKTQLGKAVMNLGEPGSIAMIQAIAYNLIHLTRALVRPKGKAKLYSIDSKKGD